MNLVINKPVPDFKFKATNNVEACLDDFKGKNIILYFYPKDATPGCTTQGQDFRDAFMQFKAINVEIFGVSRDTLKSHEAFKAKHQFPFELISDENESLCQIFDVIKNKAMYGKQVRGIERSTFFINSEGILKQEWRKVNVKGHIQEVLSFCKENTM